MYLMTCVLAAGTWASVMDAQRVYAADTAEEIEVVEDEVMALVDSLEEAEEMAKYYDITLKSYSYGVAVFEEEGIHKRVEQMEMDESFPRLSRNLEFTLPDVEFTPLEVDDSAAEPMATLYSSDEKKYQQYQLNENHISEAWEVTKGKDDKGTDDTTDDKSVLVAIIDTGIDTDHSAFPSGTLRTDLYYNAYTDTKGTTAVEDDHGHGTHVAGIIAANKDGVILSGYDTNVYTSGIYGIAPEAELMIIKANTTGEGTFAIASLIAGINYAVAKGADVINMSLGVDYETGILPTYVESMASMKAAIEAAKDAGVVVVCATGNDSESTVSYPAYFDSTIAVSATKEGFIFDSSYSTYGEQVDVAAQGTDVLSLGRSDAYATSSGTSMATPIVSGIAALILAENPTYTPDEVRAALQATAMEAGDLGRDDYYGYGIVNAYSAVLGVDGLHEVTYHYNDGSEETTTTYVAPNDLLIAPNGLDDLNGDKFLGWTTMLYGADCWDFDTSVPEDLHLYGKWDIDEGVEIAVVEDGASKVTLVVDLATVFDEVTGTIEEAEEVQFVFALYENGRLKGFTLSTYDEINTNYLELSATGNGGVDTAKLFAMDGYSVPLIAGLEYSLTK